MVNLVIFIDVVYIEWEVNNNYHMSLHDFFNFFLILKMLSMCQVNIVTRGNVIAKCQANVTATFQISVIVTC